MANVIVKFKDAIDFDDSDDSFGRVARKYK